jgi:hypothetical protein
VDQVKSAQGCKEGYAYAVRSEASGKFISFGHLGQANIDRTELYSHEGQVICVMEHGNPWPDAYVENGEMKPGVGGTQWASVTQAAALVWA